MSTCMKRTKKFSNRLALDRETVRALVLTPDKLAQINGGAPTTSRFATCMSCDDDS